MEKKIKIITCIYGNLFGTMYGGSPKNKLIFIMSLRSISKIGHEIICYTSSLEFIELTNFLKDYPNITVKVKELNEFKFHEKILYLKSIMESNTEMQFRCHNLVHLKIYILEDECKTLNDDEYIFWIDAGLSYRDLFPHYTFKYPELRKDYVSELYDNNLFNSNLFPNIIEDLDDRLFFINTMLLKQKSMEDLTKSKPYTHIVGGLYGGLVESVKNFAQTYNTILEETLVNDILCLEEKLFTQIINTTDIRVKVETFDHWYHEDNVMPEEIKGIFPFYKIIEKYGTI